MSEIQNNSQVSLQYRSLEYKKIKPKHSQVFSNLERKEREFKDFQVYRNVPVYHHKQLNKKVYLR